LADVRARIGGKIRDLRLAQNLTQEAVAEKAGVSYKFLGEVERGTANPSLLTLDRICQALGVDIDDLWGESGYARVRREHGDAVFVLRETLGAMQKVLDRAKTGRRRASRKRR
jgi:transcriptional regulator with XRE-family HTH domain